MMIFGGADGLPVVIEELSSPFRSITLGGRERPEQPVTVTTRQRASKTHYPGSSRASKQVLGTEELPLVLRGRFDDPLTILDGGAQTRMALLRAMLQGQNLCRLAWGFVVVRVGTISDLEFRVLRTHRVEYTITFDVDEPQEITPTPRRILPVNGSDVLLGLQGLFRAVDAAQSAAGAARAVGAFL